MWRVITFPFRLIGGLAVLGISHLLFVFGFILLFAFASSSRPYHLVDAEGVVVKVRDYCVAEKYDGRTRSTRAAGFCDQYQAQLESDATSYDGFPWTREPYAHVKYRDDEGREAIRQARASELKRKRKSGIGSSGVLTGTPRCRYWASWSARYWLPPCCGPGAVVGS